MPTYTYECKKCSYSFDVFHSMSAKPRVKCEECGGPCRRLLGAGAGLIFKGSGFYQTDYKNNSGDGKRTAKSLDAAKSESKSDSAGSNGTQKPAGKKADKAAGAAKN